MSGRAVPGLARAHVGKLRRVADAGTSSPNRGSLYFVNGAVDALLVGGGSVLLFVFFRFFHGPERSVGAATWAARLLWIGNWPHFSATSYRLYRSRENIRAYPLTAIVVPVVVSGMAALALASPVV